MTAHRTRFSCLLDLGNGVNAARAFDIYAALMTENAREDPPAEPFLLSLTPRYGPTRLWLRDPGSADQQLAITFVTRCAAAFGLTGRWDSNGRTSRPILWWMASMAAPIFSIYRPAKPSNGSAPGAGWLTGFAKTSAEPTSAVGMSAPIPPQPAYPLTPADRGMTVRSCQSRTPRAQTALER